MSLARWKYHHAKIICDNLAGAAAQPMRIWIDNASDRIVRDRVRVNSDVEARQRDITPSTLMVEGLSAIDRMELRTLQCAARFNRTYHPRLRAERSCRRERDGRIGKLASCLGKRRKFDHPLLRDRKIIISTVVPKARASVMWATWRRSEKTIRRDDSFKWGCFAGKGTFCGPFLSFHLALARGGKVRCGYLTYTGKSRVYSFHLRLESRRISRGSTCTWMCVCVYAHKSVLVCVQRECKYLSVRYTRTHTSHIYIATSAWLVAATNMQMRFITYPRRNQFQEGLKLTNGIYCNSGEKRKKV